jgi:aminopeptidase YwaD
MLPALWRLASKMRRSVPCEFLPVPFRGRMLRDTGRSDHAPLWDAGYPAIMATDTANMRNPHYHQPSDQIETLDLDFLTLSAPDSGRNHSLGHHRSRWS